jgi:ABC-type multidrug transport system ATPase subunit
MHLELSHISKRFGRTQALEGVDLQASAASVIALLGENGAGKSTLLRLLAGICVPDKGTIRYDGHLFNREHLDLRKRLLYTSDVPQVFADLTVAQNIATFAGVYGVSLAGREDEVQKWLLDTGAAELMLRTAGELSRGQLWKLALACVAVVRPELWLVDEPFASGMDAMGMGAFRRLTNFLKSQDSTVIYTTQMVELAADFSDHICVLRQGKVALWETSTRVKEMLSSSPEGPEDVLRGLQQSLAS